MAGVNPVGNEWVGHGPENHADAPSLNPGTDQRKNGEGPRLPGFLTGLHTIFWLPTVRCAPIER